MRDAVAKDGNGTGEKKRKREREEKERRIGNLGGTQNPVDAAAAAAAAGRDKRGRMDPLRSDHPGQ